MTYVVPEELKQMLTDSVEEFGEGALGRTLARILERHQEIVREQLARERPEAAFGHQIRFFLHPTHPASRRPHYFGAECSCRTWSSGLNALKWVLLGIQQHLEEHHLTWQEGNLVDGHEVMQQLENARIRLAYAREVLVADGYFTPDEVDDDIAPRIAELCSHMRSQLDRQLPGALLEALDQLRNQVKMLQPADAPEEPEPEPAREPGTAAAIRLRQEAQ